jgi:signal transduction histidine kinase
MRASGPYEVKPRQLRALILLLMLLPLIPTAFVVRFMVEAASSERYEARERARPVYQKFLETAGTTLAANAARQTQTEDNEPLTAQTARALVETGAADAALVVGEGGRLLPLPDDPAAPAPKFDPKKAAAKALGRALTASGVRLAAMPARGAVRWKFLSETPEPVFALGSHTAGPEPVALLVKTRQHLLEMIRAFYRRTLDPQSVLMLLDENGESVPVIGGDVAPAGQPLVEVALKPPLPLWRLQLFSAGAALTDIGTREQIVLYSWTVGGVLAATAAIAGLTGFTLTRRIKLQELSNDALAVVSHEMKTPLASVRMFVETLLERRCADPAQAEEYLRLIAQENRRLERLVEGFLTLSRLDGSHGRPLSMKPTHAEDVAGEAQERLALRLEAPGCHFRAEIAPDLPPFPADAEALTAVLVNLLDNALKYSGDDKRIDLRAFARHGHVVFTVSDNGPGIARDEQEKIFQRFYQSDRRLDRSHEGCGLGLSIVQSIVRAHGGAVSVESAPGRGSAFTVRLPFNANQPS